MIEKPKRSKQPSIQERQPPRTLQELMLRYDLDNIQIYDYLDTLVEQLNELKAQDRTVFTPTTGASQDSFGGCYYYKRGSKVHLHVGCNGLTSDTINQIYTLPEGYRPDSIIASVGAVNLLNDPCYLTVTAAGVVSIKPINGTVCLADMEYDVVN